MNPEQLLERPVLIINTKSRRGRRLRQAAQAAMQRHGVTPQATFSVTDTINLTAALDNALALNPSLIIVGGGDGTLRAAANKLAYRHVPLGVLPLGTTNNFARTLEIPLTLEGALEVITTGKVIDIDLGVANGAYFTNIASIGLAADIAAAVPATLKHLVGRLAYGLTGLALLPRHQSFTATVTTPAGTRQFVTHELIIANGRFLNGLLIAPGITVTNRELVLFHLGNQSRLDLLRGMLLLALGRRRRLREGNFVTTESATIHTAPAVSAELDGELGAITPLHVKVAPRALRVVVKQDFPEN